MKTIATSALLVVPRDGDKRVIVDPSPLDIANAKSTHVVAFTLQDDLLVAESEGSFSLEDWDEVVDTARRVCCEPNRAGTAMVVDDDPEPAKMRRFIRNVMAAKVATDLHWKAGL